MGRGKKNRKRREGNGLKEGEPGWAKRKGWVGGKGDRERGWRWF
jgi:hypothetical protein